MVLIQALAAARDEAKRIASIAQWLAANSAASASVCLPNAGSIVVYSDGSYKPAGSARVILGAN